MKRYFLLVFICFALNQVYAQKDTVVYFLNSSGQHVRTKDSADMIVFILPPDTAVDKQLSIVRGYYRNGKIRMIAGSLTHSLPLKLQGYFMEYFPNGQKMQMRNFNNGFPVGDVIQYYPNGRFYNKKSYSDEISEKQDLLCEDCSDSTGKVLAENGNGNWIEFSWDFSTITASGKVKNGRRDSTWKLILANGQSQSLRYVDGQLPDGNDGKIFTSVEQVPEFPGGLDAFARFLSKNVTYPGEARRQGIQGRVIVSFVCEKDGSLTDVKVARGIGGGCDEEAVRVIKLSPKWIPASQNNRPVRIAYSVPISFTLGNNQ